MLWIKAFHIIAVIFWAAGLLYLPRLFVYHAEAADEAGRLRFSMMEKRLYWRIMLPAMCAALLFGALLLPH
ncbi:MAG: CopD family protein, partial [Gammaproteobacteria bacterium]